MIALLDTNAYTAIMRGDVGISRALAEAHRILMSSIVIGELEYGFHHGRRVADNRCQLDAWLAETYVDFLTLTRDTTVVYGQINSTLRACGQKIPANDVWIAAHAFEHNAALWTRDTPFNYVDRLDVRSW